MTSRETILYIDHTAGLGGGEISLLNLLTHLDAGRYRAVVLLFEEGPLAVRLRDAGIETLVLPLDRSVMETRKDRLGLASALRVGPMLASAAHVRRVAGAIREIDPAIVHTNSLKADLIGGVAARIARKPIVWHVRDRIAEDYLPRPVVRSFRWLAGWLPTHVIANSIATLTTLRPDGDAGSRFTVIHNGTPARPAAVPPAREGTRRPVIGLLGRIAPWKGQDVFIRAAERVRGTGRPCEFRIIGSALFGEDACEATLVSLVRSLNLEDVVTFRGFRSDVASEMDELDVLVHASTVPEPFGQVIIEGMVAAKPVIATRAGGVVEIVDDGRTGLLTEPGSVDELAAAILRLLDDPTLAAELGRAGREEVLARFTIDRVARDVERLYDRLLKTTS